MHCAIIISNHGGQLLLARIDVGAKMNAGQLNPPDLARGRLLKVCIRGLGFRGRGIGGRPFKAAGFMIVVSKSVNHPSKTEDAKEEPGNIILLSISIKHVSRTLIEESWG